MADKMCSDCGETEEGGATFSSITFPTVCDDCVGDWELDDDEEDDDDDTD